MSWHMNVPEYDLWKSVLPFHHVEPRDQPQVITLSGQCLYPMSHSARISELVFCCMQPYPIALWDFDCPHYENLTLALEPRLGTQVWFLIYLPKPWVKCLPPACCAVLRRSKLQDRSPSHQVLVKRNKVISRVPRKCHWALLFFLSLSCPCCHQEGLCIRFFSHVLPPQWTQSNGTNRTQSFETLSQVNLSSL